MKISYLNIGIIVICLLLPGSYFAIEKADSLSVSSTENLIKLPKIEQIIKGNASLNEGLNDVIAFADSLLFAKHAQESLVILNKALENPFFKDYSVRRELMFKIYDVYSYQWDFSKSIPAVIDIFKADSLRKDIGLMANSSLWVATTYTDYYDTEKSLEWIKKSRNYASQVDSTRILSYLYMLEGDVALAEENNVLAFENYKKAESYLTSLPISNTSALIYLSLAGIYSTLEQQDIAVEYYLKTADVYDKLEDYSGVSLALYNLAVAYGNSGDYEKALKYSLQSIDICQKEENKFAISDMLVSSYALTSQIYEILEDWENSLKYLQLSDQVTQANTSLGTTMEMMNQYIRFYTKLDNYEKALYYINLSDSLITEQKTPPTDISFMAARLDFYEHFGFYEKATQISREIISSIRKETSEEVANLVADYEAQKNLDEVTQEKQKLSLENTEKNLTIANQYKTIYLILSLILFISIITIFLFHRYRTKKKLAKLLNIKVEERTRELKEANEKLLAEIEDHKATTNQLLFAQRLTGVGEIASGLAHEIRNPLTNILASMQILKSKYDIENDQFTGIIIRNAQNANTRVNELLNYSQPIAFKKETISLHRIITEVINLAKGKLNKEHISIKYKSENIQDLVSVDKKQITTVFLNFILNSIDAIKTTDKEGLIEITTRDEFNFIVIDFTDNGCGIKENVIPKIFQPFFTNKEGGTGLGLNLAHKIVHQHGGLITAKSQLGVFTTISVKLLNMKS